MSINFCQTIQARGLEGNCDNNMVLIKKKMGEKDVRVRKKKLPGIVSKTVELDAKNSEKVSVPWTLEETEKKC